MTSPHIHPVFAELLARGVRELWELLERPDPLRVAEVGAGDGTLAAQLLGHLRDLPLEYTAVDRSPGARGALTAIPGIRTATDLPDDPHLVLANELLDNLPFRRVRMGPGGPAEVRVGMRDGELVEVLTPPDGDVNAAATALDDGEETVIPEGALGFVDTLAATLRHGYALLIDYGDEGRPGGGTHGYRDHRMVADVLDQPGGADITAGVDFAAVASRARERGLEAFPSVTQHRALAALGFETWARAELERQHRLLDARDGLQAVRAWSARSRATLLVDPAALGRFRWLILASPGLSIPRWLAAAADVRPEPDRRGAPPRPSG